MKTELKKFAAYVKSVYGDEFTEQEIAFAIGIYVERCNHSLDITYGDGDSIDRERVREIMILELR